jgi:hypothetical protein
MRILTLGLLVGCGPSETAVRSAIEKANYCDVAEDCGNAGSVCPFGCDVLVNVDEVGAIRDLMQNYAQGRSVCLYDCAALQEVTCEAGICVGRYTE